MKALSIYPQYAQQIATGFKTIECRSWRTNFRGNLLICSSNKKVPGTIPGYALAVVTLVDIVPFEHKHLLGACMSEMEFQEGMYAWIFTSPRLIKPFPVKGKRHLWDCSHEVEFFPDGIDQMEIRDLKMKYWEPITV